MAKSSVREFITEKGFDYLAGEHDGYQRLADPVTHARSLLFIKSNENAAMPAYIVVRDSFAAREHHRYALHYHFDPACRVTEHSGDWLRAERPGGHELLVRWCGSAQLQTRVVEGRVSRCYGQQEAAPVVVCEAKGQGAQSFITCLLPVPAGHANATAEFEPSGASMADGRCLRVRSGDVADVVLMGDADTRVENELLAARGEIAWVRAVDGRVVSASLVCGRSLECADGFAFFTPTTARHCAIELRSNEVEINITGTNCFRLTLPEPTAAVIINGVRRVLDPRWRRAAFIEQSTGWRLSEIDC